MVAAQEASRKRAGNGIVGVRVRESSHVAGPSSHVACSVSERIVKCRVVNRRRQGIQDNA